MRKIDHVIVLMLENRSFDNVLGELYPKSERFDGLDLTETNPWHAPDGGVSESRTWSATKLPSDCMPQVDPGERFDDFNMQIFGLALRGPMHWLPGSAAHLAGRLRGLVDKP
jgi:phospholipase C